MDSTYPYRHHLPDNIAYESSLGIDFSTHYQIFNFSASVYHSYLDATSIKESIQEIKGLPEENKKGVHPDEFGEIEKYNTLWDVVIDLFNDSFISDEALDKIELVLLEIPEIVKQYYDALISQDEDLQNMIEKMASQKYKEALSIIEEIQSKPCAMSNVPSEEFDIESLGKGVGDHAFKILHSKKSYSF